MFRFLVPLIVCAIPSFCTAQMRITEWVYGNDEFVEFTNVGTTPIDMNGWSYDDDSRIAATVDLSAFGVVMPGESVILCEAPAATFTTTWNLTGVDVIGDLTVNLGRNDEINLYDAGLTLVDRLAYGDQNYAGTIRTQNASGSPCRHAVGFDDVYAWTLAFAGDARGSSTSAGGVTANPGSYVNVDAATTTFGVGCPGTGNQIPILGANGCPTFGGQVNVALVQGPATAPTLVLYGLSRVSIPIGNCTLYTVPFLTQGVSLDASGSLSFLIDVPATLTAPGSVAMQVLVFDPGALDGFTATNGLEVIVR